MGLPKVFKSAKSIPKSYLTILLSDSVIQAAMWQADRQGVTILSKSAVQEYDNKDQVSAKTDKALQELGKQSEEINDVVFGLQHTWVNEQGITADKKPFLKSITEDLGLSAVGFVITSEAIARQLIVDDPRLSTLVVEFSQHELYLSLIDHGKLVSTKFVGRSGQTMADMAEALARLNAHLEEEIKFPSKILITSSDLKDSELKEQQQLLLSHDWVNSHPFLHPPTVDILDSAVILESIIKQGGVSVAGLSETQLKSKVIPPKPVEEKEVIEDKLPVGSSTDELVESKSAQATSFGIPIKTAHPPEFQPELPIKDEVNLPDEVKQPRPPSEIKMKFLAWFNDHKLFAIGGFAAGVVALLVLGGIWLNTAVIAEVILSIETQPISKEASITLDPDLNSTDVDKLILAASTVEEKVSGDRTKETTGVKVVGDEAVGKITLYNKTEAVKIFDQGTKVSKGDLVFTLNDKIEVASASTKKKAGGEEIEYGQAEANVTASDIGADHNLAKETELQVASFDPGTYSATTAESLTGGSSREVRVVSANDIEQLLDELKEKLLAEANATMTEETEDGVYIVASNTHQIDERDYDAQIGDEVSNLTLSLSLTVQALSYKTENLKPLAQKVLESDIPHGYTLANSEPQILSAPDQEASDSGAVSLVVNISSQAKPDLNYDDLIQSIAGKRLEEAKQTLTAKSAINSVEINFIPSIAAKLYPRLPKDPAKIEIK